MTVVVTVNVEGRYRGFLASVMLEIAPGVYTSPQMTTGIRDRIWDVLTRWYYELGQGAIVMTWRTWRRRGLNISERWESRRRRSWRRTAST